MAHWDERLLNDGGEVLITDASWWAARAAEAYTIATLCEDDISCSIMIRLCRYYESLAERYA